jgi:DNA-binding NarL/FixJ family response regulator
MREETGSAAERLGMRRSPEVLSPREQEITELIAQGLGAGEIAHRLHLSTHTLRDYVKAIFEKVHVSSRGELVAKLFADHYAPTHTDPSSQQRVGA